MRCAVLPSAALIGLLASGPGIAADAPAVPKPLPFPINWTGFYAGGHIGAGFAYRDWVLGDGSAVSNQGSTFIAGGQAGFNYQVGRWVLGAEGDLAWGNFRDENFCPDGLTVCRTRQTWLATATGRLGYAFDPALFYLKGGAAFTRLDHFRVAMFPAVPDTAGSDHRVGWTAGAGIEMALSRSWSVKFEYDYLDFGRDAIALRNVATGAFAETISVTHRAHEAKLGF